MPHIALLQVGVLLGRVLALNTASAATVGITTKHGFAPVGGVEVAVAETVDAIYVAFATLAERAAAPEGAGVAAVG